MKVDGINMDTAVILDIQRLSTEDGPGIRTTVFFKGCSLACSWCQNPESIRFDKQIEWIPVGRCIGCGSCLEVCKTDALRFEPDGLRIDREKCVACGACVNICPTNALEMKGKEWQVDALVKEVVKDKAYFGNEGGITVSGGDPLMQSDFVARFFAELKKRDINTALDTAGLVSKEGIKKALPFTDLVLYDLKLIDPEQHRLHTGHSNAQILDNIKDIANAIRLNGRPNMWVRTPIIPGVTNTKENIQGIGRFIGENIADCVQKWELCAFNNLCKDKYDRLDMEWDFKDASLITKEEMEALSDIAKSSGVDPSIVTWSGSTKLEN